jgi:TonB family protein
MRGSVLGSGTVHVALFLALLVVRTPASIVIPGPEVVQVALTDASTLAAVTPPPPERPRPDSKVEEIQPVEEEGVKLKPEKPPQQKPKVEPQRPRPQVRWASLPSASVGPAGLSGDVAVEGGDFEFTYYLELIRNRIATNWSPPSGVATQRVRAVVYFKVARNGALSAVRMETASGVEFFDRSALRAVMISDPLPPLPLGFAGSDLGVHFGFEWESP